MGRSKHSELRVVNDTNTDIVRTVVSGIDNYDWDGGSRPDCNFQNVHIRAKSSVQRRAELNHYASNCPFTMKLEFRNGLTDVFTVHQRHAIGCCAGFNHYQRSHDIFYQRRDGILLEIVVKNTQAQLHNEQAEQLNRSAQASLQSGRYQEALDNFGRALQQANETRTRAAAQDGQLKAHGQWGLERLGQAWAAEESDRCEEAAAKFKEARVMFERAHELSLVELVQSKIDGNDSFNRGNDLEKLAHQLFDRARSAGEHNAAQDKYREALVQYEKAASKFQFGRKSDSRFESCVQLCKEAAEAVGKTIDNIEKIELSLNMDRVKINDKDQAEQELYHQEDNLQLVIDI